MKISMIVAHAKNLVIGLDNKMPWHISGDLKYFKAKTMGKPIIMGRKTFESMGKPLPGRTSIVITRNADYQVPEGVIVDSNLDDAVDQAKKIALRDGLDEIMVIGGAQIYKMALEYADRLYITEIDLEPKGDAYFPMIEKSEWEETSRDLVKAQSADEQDYAFVIYDRIN